MGIQISIDIDFSVNGDLVRRFKSRIGAISVEVQNRIPKMVVSFTPPQESQTIMSKAQKRKQRGANCPCGVSNKSSSIKQPLLARQKRRDRISSRVIVLNRKHSSSRDAPRPVSFVVKKPVAFKKTLQIFSTDELKVSSNVAHKVRYVESGTRIPVLNLGW